MFSRRSSLLRHGALALLPLALTACSSGTSSTTAASTPATSASATHSADPNAGLLNGTKLKALLLPVSVLPKGYSVDASGTRDTGTVFQPTKTLPLDLTGACKKLGTSAWMQAAGVESVAFAQTDFLNSSQEMFAEEVDTFRGNDAKQLMTRLEKVLTHCAHYTDSSSGVKATVSVKLTKMPTMGDETLKAVSSSPDLYGGTTLVATRVGNMVVTTVYNVQSKDMGSAVVGLTQKIVTKAKAAVQQSG